MLEDECPFKNSYPCLMLPLLYRSRIDLKKLVKQKEITIFSIVIKGLKKSFLLQ